MKQFRILRVSHIKYPKALAAFLNHYPDIFQLSYEEKLNLLFSEKLVYSNSFSRAMRQLGHEADEVIYDVEWLQKTWARENCVSFSRTTWKEKILLAQIKKYRPEILYFQHSPPLHGDTWRNLKHIFPFINKVIVHRAYPGDFDTLGSADLLLVGTRHMVAQYASHDIHARLLYHYFDEAVLDLVSPFQATYPLTFLGSSGYGMGLAHATRYWLLKQLLELYPIDMWLDEKDDTYVSDNLPISVLFNLFQSCKRLALFPVKESLRRMPTSAQKALAESRSVPSKMRYFLHHNMKQLAISRLEAELPPGQREPKKRLLECFPDRCRSSVFGLEYYRILAQSLISFNCHTDAVAGDVGNLRMFQATGMGSCLLTDTGKNISDLYEPDSEVVTYSCEEEAHEKILFLLNNKEKASEIAIAGHQRTIRDHTAIKRCEQIDFWLQESVR